MRTNACKNSGETEDINILRKKYDSWSGKIIFLDFISNEKWNGPISDPSVGDRLKFVTQFVDTETDFQSLLKENFDLDGGPGKERIGMIGLHTCGNLAPDSLRQAYFCAPSCFFITDKVI